MRRASALASAAIFAAVLGARAPASGAPGPVDSATVAPSRPEVTKTSTPAAPAVIEGATPRAPGGAKDDELSELYAFLSSEQLVVVTASKREERLESAPSIVTVFTREDIERLGAKRLIDVLRLTPGFVEVSAPMERNIASRGLHATTSQDIVVLIDGLRMNDFLANTAAPDAFLLDIAERVEIVRGPGTALYGSNALTGVVNIVTRTGSSSPAIRAGAAFGTHDTFDATLQLSDTFQGGASVFFSGTMIGSGGTPVDVPGSEDVLLTRLGQNTADGIQGGENLTVPSPDTRVRVSRYAPGFEAFLKLSAADRWALRLGAGYSQLEPQRTELESLVDQALEPQPAVRRDLRASADFSRTWGDPKALGALTLRPALQFFSHDQRSQQVPDAFYALAAEEGRTSILAWSGNEARASMDAELARELETSGFISELALLAGVHFEYNVAFDYRLTVCEPDADHAFGPSPYSQGTPNDYVCFAGAPLLDEGTAIDAFGNALPQDASFLGNGDDLLLGVFAQASAKLPLNLGVTLGARLDHNPEYQPVVTPRVALVKPLGEHFYMKGQYASAFVYPPFLYRTGNRQAGIVGSPDIVPQGMKTLEMLAGYMGGGIRLELNGYVNFVKDFITFDQARLLATREYAFDNRGDLDIVGAEASVSVRVWEDRFQATLGAATSRPLGSTDDLFLVEGKLGGASKYPPYQGSLVLFVQPSSGVSFTTTATFQDRIPFLLSAPTRFTGVIGRDGASYTSKNPGDYDTRRLTVDALVAIVLFEGWRATFSVKNAFDSASHLVGATSVPYAMEGRVVRMGLSYEH